MLSHIPTITHLYNANSFIQKTCIVLHLSVSCLFLCFWNYLSVSYQWKEGEAWLSYLEPSLSLLLVLNCKDESLSPWKWEAKLMLLAASIFWDINDLTEIQGQVKLWCAIFGAFVTLRRKKRKITFICTIWEIHWMEIKKKEGRTTPLLAIPEVCCHGWWSTALPTGQSAFSAAGSQQCGSPCLDPPDSPLKATAGSSPDPWPHHPLHRRIRRSCSVHLNHYLKNMQRMLKSHFRLSPQSRCWQIKRCWPATEWFAHRSSCVGHLCEWLGSCCQRPHNRRPQ